MRYLPLSEADRQSMLLTIGVSRVTDLFDKVPHQFLLDNPPELPAHAPEPKVERHLSKLASRNMAASDVPFFVGAGAYYHHVPATVDHLIQRSEFLTAYTPYQPEISQGTLQVLFEFQTQVANLTGMDVANASMYDGSTAMAEAALMARRITRRSRIVVSGGVHPHYVDVSHTYLGNGGNFIAAPSDPGCIEDLAGLIDDTTAAVIVQTPDVFGNLRDIRALADAAHEKGALLVVVVTEIVALGLIEAPGVLGADIVVAEGQSIGNALSFGGPYVGLFATRDKFVRQMPGRICGETRDADGRRGYTLTLSTREQHIRREKATSNICTNSGLCALAFSIHLSMLGEKGLETLARINHARAVETAEALSAIPGVELINSHFFNEFTLRLPVPARPLVAELTERGVLAGVAATRLRPDDPDLENLLIVAATEMVSSDDISALSGALQEALK